MIDKTPLFTLPDVKSQIREITQKIKYNETSDINNICILAPVLSSMSDSSGDWDSFSQFTINKYGTQFRIILNDILARPNEANADLLLSYTYLFLIESDLSTATPITDEFLSIRENIASRFKDRTDRAGVAVSFGTNQLPILILKSTLNSPELATIKELGLAANNTQAKIDQWQQELSVREVKVNHLNATLERQKDAFNFVLLNQGFAQLETLTKSSLKKQRIFLIVFGILLLSPAIVDIILIANGILDFDPKKLVRLVSCFAISLTSTLILLYYFRIVLRDVDSKEAQLMQIRLRMTLCQFIHSYADFAAELKEKNVDALSKFESLIFSGIVGTQDKLPSTFDGIEQLSTLLNTARPK